MASAIHESTTNVPYELTCMTFWKNCGSVSMLTVRQARPDVTHRDRVLELVVPLPAGSDSGTVYTTEERPFGDGCKSSVTGS